MSEYARTVKDVIGEDKTLLDYWDKMPDKIKGQFLESNAVVSTLGELQILATQMSHLNTEPPKVF